MNQVSGRNWGGGGGGGTPCCFSLLSGLPAGNGAPVFSSRMDIHRSLSKGLVVLYVRYSQLGTGRGRLRDPFANKSTVLFYSGRTGLIDSDEVACNYHYHC
ncbi:Protein LAZ1 [Zea mays]|uniref:Protein LAZ1 n=1 Tax=Zea mays TaxID=4577 RepID=A0A1D6EWK0_MAIZE|nr:Protein LAZ1 [Zea mays]ONM23891.1 Protein LAZ1 [Zea mays]